MSRNTATIGEPIWDSRNSDEPALPVPGAPALPGSYSRQQCVAGLRLLREAARKLDAQNGANQLSLEWLLSHIEGQGFPVPED